MPREPYSLEQELARECWILSEGTIGFALPEDAALRWWWLEKWTKFPTGTEVHISPSEERQISLWQKWGKEHGTFLLSQDLYDFFRWAKFFGFFTNILYALDSYVWECMQFVCQAVWSETSRVPRVYPVFMRLFPILKRKAAAFPWIAEARGQAPFPPIPGARPFGGGQTAASQPPRPSGGGEVSPGVASFLSPSSAHAQMGPPSPSPRRSQRGQPAPRGQPALPAPPRPVSWAPPCPEVRAAPVHEATPAERAGPPQPAPPRAAPAAAAPAAAPAMAPPPVAPALLGDDGDAAAASVPVEDGLPPAPESPAVTVLPAVPRSEVAPEKSDPPPPPAPSGPAPPPSAAEPYPPAAQPSAAESVPVQDDAECGDEPAGPPSELAAPEVLAPSEAPSPAPSVAPTPSFSGCPRAVPAGGAGTREEGFSLPFRGAGVARQLNAGVAKIPAFKIRVFGGFGVLPWKLSSLPPLVRPSGEGAVGPKGSAFGLQPKGGVWSVFSPWGAQTSLPPLALSSGELGVDLESSASGPQSREDGSDVRGQMRTTPSASAWQKQEGQRKAIMARLLWGTNVPKREMEFLGGASIPSLLACVGGFREWRPLVTPSAKLAAGCWPVLMQSLPEGPGPPGSLSGPSAACCF